MGATEREAKEAKEVVAETRPVIRIRNKFAETLGQVAMGGLGGLELVETVETRAPDAPRSSKVAIGA